MEQYGFARATVAGEYSPLYSRKLLDTDKTISSTTFSEFMRTTITVDSPNESLVIAFYFSGNGTAGTGNTPQFRILVDSTVLITARGDTNEVGSLLTASIVTTANVAPGRHDVIVQWHSANTSALKCQPLTVTGHGADLTVIRDQIVGDREMSGVGVASWPALLTCGTVYEEISSTVSDSNTTPVTFLLSADIYTRETTSSLFIVFDVNGTNSTATATNDASAKFQLFVDGVANRGTGGLAAQANVRFSARIIAVVGPMQPGLHTVSVYWGGGAGSSITPSSGTEGARLSVKEIFCADTGNLISDMGGFPTLGFSSAFVPQTRYAQLDSSVTGLTTPADLVEIDDIWSRSDNSIFLVQTSICCASIGTGGSAILILFVNYGDGVGFVEVERRISRSFTSSDSGLMSVAFTWELTFPPGIYGLKTALIGQTAMCDVTNHPEYCHHSLVVREISNTGAYINS